MENKEYFFIRLKSKNSRILIWLPFFYFKFQEMVELERKNINTNTEKGFTKNPSKVGSL
ncbi:hypothetical protein ACSVH7_12445 [Flavobacterium sp. TSSA_36]